jgi:hypothetical protein
MSLTQIMEYLKDDGYKMSGYGATEALSAIIMAFREDGKLQVEKSVDFEGYFYCNGDIHACDFDFSSYWSSAATPSSRFSLCKFSSLCESISSAS